MPAFNVQVMEKDGRISRRRVVAASAAAARTAAELEGRPVIHLENDGFLVRGNTTGRRKFNLALFAHELSTLLQAGLSLVETLETLAERETRRSGQDEETRVIGGLLAGIKQGLPFSAALARTPELFPDLFVSTVAASEQTGDLATGLKRYLQHDEQVSALRNKIVSASLYPVLLLLIGGSVALFLLLYLVPRFSDIYQNLGTNVPLASRLLMTWGNFVGNHLAIALPTIVGAIGTMAYALTRPTVRERLALYAERNRWIGERIRLVRLSRFYRALGLLLRGGIPMIKALQVIAPLLSDGSRDSVGRLIRGISEGRALSECLEEAGLSTEVASRLVRAGERNGQIADMLDRTAQFHDDEVSRWIDGFMKLFEPALMAAIGIVIGAIVVLLYLPIFELASSLQ